VLPLIEAASKTAEAALQLEEESTLSKQWKKTALAAVATVAIGWGWAAMAQDASNSHGHGNNHSKVTVPLSATGGIAVSNVGTNCSQTDTVTLSSDSAVHVDAHLKRNSVRVHAHHVQGTGTLGDYEAHGSQEANLGGSTIPANGTVAATAQLELTAENSNCASQPLPLKLNLVFSNGELQSSSTACVAGTTGC
jgi:hypothetical protein